MLSQLSFLLLFTTVVTLPTTPKLQDLSSQSLDPSTYVQQIASFIRYLQDHYSDYSSLVSEMWELLGQLAADQYGLLNLPPCLPLSPLPYTPPCYPNIGCFPKTATPSICFDPNDVSVQFLAYNSPDNFTKLDPSNEETFSVIDSTKDLVFLVHGFLMDGQDADIQQLKDSLLEYADSVGTVVVVDWSDGIQTDIQRPYRQSSANAQVVGRKLTYLVQKLRQSRDIDEDRVHLIGFSLGAHVVGFAGKWAQAAFDWSYGRITGLDAALLLFESYPEAQLTKADGQFVDAIHTSDTTIKAFGTQEAYGHLDFYPGTEEGHHQPECADKDLGPAFLCDHRMAIKYFEASLRGECELAGYEQESPKEGDPSDTRMGFYVNQTARGVRYTVKPKKQFPYCY